MALYDPHQFNVSVTEHPGRRLPGVMPMAGGGYNVAEKQNPNSGMATYQRNNPGTNRPVGGYATGSAQSHNPMYTGTGESAASANMGLMMRGLENARAEHQQSMFPTEQVDAHTFAPVMAGNHPTKVGGNVQTNFAQHIGGPLNVEGLGPQPDPKWEMFKQALAEAGVDKVRADPYTMGGSNPSFFAGQKPTPTYEEQLAQQGLQFHGFGNEVTYSPALRGLQRR